ncbi:MAG TPA: lipid-A-disaccharide synthase [Candidatus Cloacimonadota bacterium]|nr:lipid-A-disaccharide synthase [Candidatus Cloacimonadota bacterium]
MQRNVTIFWLAGESSGDLHASIVMRAVNESLQNVRHVGIGGPLMQREGLKTLFPFDKFAVMGFTEVAKHLGFFLKVEKAIARYLRMDKPDLFIPVDYPGLNLRVAKIADDLRIPVLYYICPQFWAWKHKRVFALKEDVRHVACILPFEKELLDSHNVTSSYVGHPITEEIRIELDRESFARFFGLDPAKKWIGFMPGSRNHEIQRMLPVFLKSARLMDPEQYQFLFSKSRAVAHSLYMNILDDHREIKAHIIDGYNYEMMKYCEALIGCSGTVTLEAAYIGTPMVICYKASPLSYAIGRYLVRIKHMGLPNIIMEDTIFPELLQHDAKQSRIAQEVFNLLSDEAYSREVKVKLLKLRQLLEGKRPSVEMLRIIKELLKLDE